MQSRLTLLSVYGLLTLGHDPGPADTVASALAVLVVGPSKTSVTAVYLVVVEVDFTTPLLAVTIAITFFAVWMHEHAVLNTPGPGGENADEALFQYSDWLHLGKGAVAGVASLLFR